MSEHVERCRELAGRREQAGVLFDAIRVGLDTPSNLILAARWMGEAREAVPDAAALRALLDERDGLARHLDEALEQIRDFAAACDSISRFDEHIIAHARAVRAWYRANGYQPVPEAWKTPEERIAEAASRRMGEAND